MAKPKPAEVVGKIVDLLTPLSSDDRGRVISAARTLLGDAAGGKKDNDAGVGDEGGAGDMEFPASPKVMSWRKQNSVSVQQLAQFFHVDDGKADVIAGEMPGKNKKEKTLNAYVLAGLAQFIATGAASFTDKEARALCNAAGCYDSPNHAATLKAKGNWFTGSKDKGWVLTTPGLKHAATLVKAASSEQE